MNREGLSTRQLAALKLPAAPGSHQGWEKHAITHGWEIREHPGRGRGGIVREFIPPPALATLIAQHQAGKKVRAEEVHLAMGKTATGAAVRRPKAGPERKAASASKRADKDFSQTRFSAWLMARMMNHAGNASADGRLQLDRQELALRVLILVAEQARCGLAALVDHMDIVDRAINLAITAKPETTAKA